MNDPLLKLSLFRHSDNLYLVHLHEIVLSFVFYQFILYPIIAPWLNKLFFGKHYTELESRKTKLNFDIHTVSMFQCILSLVLVYPILFTPLSLNIATYYDPYSSLVSSLTMGYFMWDLCVCLRHFSLFGVGFLGHACASLFVFYSTLRPFCQSWVGKFLIFEASTPFVNINWYISQLSRTSSKPVVPAWFNVLNGILLIGVFFLVRIVWGFTAILLLLREMWKVWDQVPQWLLLSIIGINILLDSLNVFWLSKMIKIAKKLASGNSSGSGKRE